MKRKDMLDIIGGIDENFIEDPVIVLGAFPQGVDPVQRLLCFHGFSGHGG